MVYACDYASPWWETTTTISIDGGDTLDLRFSRSRRNLTACTLIVTSSLLENDTGELYREERGDASSRRGNGGVLRNAKLRALKAKDVYHGCFIRIINVCRTWRRLRENVIISVHLKDNYVALCRTST